MLTQLFGALFGTRSQSTFQFRPRWKEELVVTGPGGVFVLGLPMGVYSACLPTQEVWINTAPEWAKDLWPVLEAESAEWCKNNKAKLHIDETAFVFIVE
jgi:hypothetical protein